MMGTDMAYFSVCSVPDKPLDGAAMLSSMKGRSMTARYDSRESSVILGFPSADSQEARERMERASPGLVLAPMSASYSPPLGRCAVMVPYSEVPRGDALLGLLSSGGPHGSVTIVITRFGIDEIGAAKRHLEAALTGYPQSSTTGSNYSTLLSRMTSSTHSEDFMRSEEKALLAKILESVNASILKCGKAYSVHLIVEGGPEIREHVRDAFLAFGECEMDLSPSDLPAISRLMKPLPYGESIARNFLLLEGRVSLSYPARTRFIPSAGDVRLGAYLSNSITPSGMDVMLERSALNLGLLVTGLPGTGKTSEMMAIVRGLLLPGNAPLIAVISPTNEWNGFAASNGMRSITLNDGNVPINFFEPPPGSDRPKFYESLAAVLSSASNAGPYRGPMEKCMLNAFRALSAAREKVDPVNAYCAIEDSVKAFHAKKTNAGYKYTKHGENIKSSLENLRGIIGMPEYATSAGIDVREFMERGVVFDLSRVGAGSKPYMYALILAQIYAIAEQFGVDCEDRLNMLICVEEAQLVFGSEESAAVEDIKYRIQDFRKRGIGLALLTHNSVDIRPEIRRLLQNKIYLKQSPDVAAIASRDMVFTYADEDTITSKMKHLESGTAALTYVVKDGGKKSVYDTVFIKTAEPSSPVPPARPAPPASVPKVPKAISMEISFRMRDSPDAAAVLKAGPLTAAVRFLGYDIMSSEVGPGGTVEVDGAISGALYTVALYSKRARFSAERAFRAAKRIEIEI